MGTADWPNYLNFISLASAVGGILIFGLIAGWVFGREHADRTLKDLLALPTSRSAIVGAKFLLVGLWSFLLTGIIFLTGLRWGLYWRRRPSRRGPSAGLRQRPPTALNIVLATVIAWAASAGGGYMPAFGVMILEIALAQIIAVLGWGEYFPWSVPGLYAQGEALGVISYLIVLLAGLAGAALTFAWWELADHAR
jgi:ABC-2 type transport system permease protein